MNMQRPGFIEKEADVQRPGFIEHKTSFQRPGFIGEYASPVEKLQSAVNQLSVKFIGRYGITGIKGQYNSHASYGRPHAIIVVKVVGNQYFAKSALPPKIWGIPIKIVASNF